MLPNACRSLTLLAFALVFSVSCGIGKSNLVFADSHIVDDWDPSLQWNGGWTGFKGEPAPTWDRTLTWGNISSATVTFTFTGTSIQVFGAFKPVGIWSMQSQYAIDGGSPTTFVPSQQVSAEAYNQSFYHSGTLSAGEHTLKITNLGSQLWLDYFLVNDDGGVNVVSAGGGPSVGASTATTTATVIESATTTPTPSAGPTPASTGSSAASTSSAQSLPTQLNVSVSVSATNFSTLATTSPSASGSSDGSLTPPLASSPPSSPTSSDATAPARGAEATQDPSSGASHTMSPGLIAGVTLGGLAVLAILLAVWWRVRRKQRGLSAWVAPYPFSRPPGPDASSRTETSFYAHDASPRESQYSATLLIGPRASRRASSLADLADSYSYSYSPGQPSPQDRTPQSPHAHQSPHSPYSPYTDRAPHSAYGGHLSSVRRSTDGGVTIAGGPGVDGGGDAPSISDVQSIKSRLPPVYQAYGAGGRSG